MKCKKLKFHEKNQCFGWNGHLIHGICMKPSPSTLIFQGGGDYTHFRGVVIGLNGDFLDFAFFSGFGNNRTRNETALLRAGGEGGSRPLRPKSK